MVTVEIPDLSETVLKLIGLVAFLKAFTASLTFLIVSSFFLIDTLLIQQD
jgi:hypothetical protein